MKKGKKVRLIQPVIEGEVVSTRYNEEKEGLEHLVEWTGSDGEVHQRWFAESDLEEAQP